MGKHGRKFKYCIITDGDGKPMAWDEIGKQLSYCTDDRWKDEHHPVRFYTNAKAARLIKKSLSIRSKRKSSYTSYRTMPFELSYWQESRSKGIKLK